MKKRILGGLAAAAMLTGGLAFTPAGTASAHTGDLKASYVCQADGQYKVTYELDISQTGLTGNTMWGIGTTKFKGTPTSSTNPITLNNGPVASAGAGTILLGTQLLPGTTTVGPWVYAFTTWSDNYKKGSDGRVDTFRGDCKSQQPPAVPSQESVTSCDAKTVTTTSYSTPYIYQANGDKWVPGTKVRVGQPVVRAATAAELNQAACAPPAPPETPTRQTVVTSCEAKTVTTTNFETPPVYDEATRSWGPGVEVQVGQPVVRAATAAELNEAECAQPPKPDDNVVSTEWVDGQFACGDTTVEQSRTVTTTKFTYDAETRTWVEGVPVVETETQTRNLTAAEQYPCATTTITTTPADVVEVLPPAPAPTTSAPAAAPTVPATGLPATGSNGTGMAGLIALLVTSLGGVALLAARRRNVTS